MTITDVSAEGLIAKMQMTIDALKADTGLADRIDAGKNGHLFFTTHASFNKSDLAEWEDNMKQRRFDEVVKKDKVKLNETIK